MTAETQTQPAKRYALPCGCRVAEYPGHINKLLCPQHMRETFKPRAAAEAPGNLDLIGQ